MFWHHNSCRPIRFRWGWVWTCPPAPPWLSGRCLHWSSVWWCCRPCGPRSCLDRCQHFNSTRKKKNNYLFFFLWQNDELLSCDMDRQCAKSHFKRNLTGGEQPTALDNLEQHVCLFLVCGLTLFCTSCTPFRSFPKVLHTFPKSIGEKGPKIWARIKFLVCW